MSNVRELMDNLVDRVVELGVGKDFLAHPAFIPALGEVSSLIGRMKGIVPEDVHVSKDNGAISFSYTSSEGDKCKFTLRASASEFSCVCVEEPHLYIGNSGNAVIGKNATEIVARLGNYGNVTITTNFGDMTMIDEHHYSVSSSTNRCEYDKFGVMCERESRYYEPKKEQKGDFREIGTLDLLWTARRAAPDYTSSTLLVRHKLDVARIVCADADGYKFYGYIPLSQQHGLRDMAIPNHLNTKPIPEVNIPPLMESEIEAMIGKEDDERVAEGLRRYVDGRADFSYNSSESKNGDSPKALV